MIDAANITNYNQTTQELEEFITFWVFAAGKNGTRAANIVNKLSNDVQGSLFKYLKQCTLNNLVDICKYYGTGCHNIKARSIYELVHADLDLTTCSIKDLESIYGIGRKTSRCFMVHSRAEVEYACLDTHILKFLSREGVPNVPKSTPSTKKEYLRLEQEFLTLAKKYGKLPAVLDLEIWNKYSIK
jgi:thermostable 8-oxoguanine DNA glycosylase